MAAFKRRVCHGPSYPLQAGLELAFFLSPFPCYNISHTPVNFLLYFNVCVLQILLFESFVLMLLGAVTKLLASHYTSIIDKVIWLQTILSKISSTKNAIISEYECRIHCDSSNFP
jgi:hypothetical protein